MSLYYGKVLHGVKDSFTNGRILDLSFSDHSIFADGELMEKSFSFSIFKIEEDKVYQLFINDNGAEWNQSIILTKEMVVGDDNYQSFKNLGLNVEIVIESLINYLYSNAHQYHKRIVNRFIKDSNDLQKRKVELDKKVKEVLNEQKDYEDEIIKLKIIQESILK